jgi:zinc-ribbon domain
VPETDFETPRFCARCGQPIVVDDARFCKSCGAPLTRSPLIRRDPGFSPIVAFVLSIIPGVGHIYRGKLLRGMLWFFGVSLAYTAGGPLMGPLIHFICAANAAFSGVIGEDAMVR